MAEVITPESSRVIIARGPRAAEAELLRLVREFAPRTPDQLGQPLRIVVPSASLRRHVLVRLAQAGGRPLAGVLVQTLARVAQETVERAGGAAGPAGELTSILIRRRAAAEGVLGPALRGLDDGYGIVEGAVRDLLDAGFVPEHAAVVADKLGDLDGIVEDARLDRAAGVATVAAAVALELDVLGALRIEQQPQLAAALLRAHGPAVLPSRGAVIHGFADATGVAADLIHALAAVVGVTVILDRPPDPARCDTDDAGCVFLNRFESHLGGLARLQAEQRDKPPELELFHAGTSEAEARQVAHRVRALIDRGAVPETIGVVARELSTEAIAYRRHFDRLGIPFSGSEATVPGGLHWRRARLLSEILKTGAELPAELWLEAVEGPVDRPEIGLALRTLGVVSLADLAGHAQDLDPRGAITLPMPDTNEGEARPGRKIETGEVLRLAERAAWLAEAQASWPERAVAAEHSRAAEAVVEALGWPGDGSPDDPVLDAVRGLATELPQDFELARGEFIEGIRRRLAEVGLEPVGGSGGGVQLLTVMEARSRTFDHLFMIGLNRGRFPRVVREDALLPDTVRGHLAAEVLPDVPVKARGIDEERYLFAQLCDSARTVTLSWRDTEKGSPVAPSPFVERLRRELGLEVVAWSLPLAPGGDLEPRPAWEHAILAAETADRTSLMSVLAETVLEGGERVAVQVAGPMEWAAGRVDVLDAMEPGPGTPEPGPWAGLVGETVAAPGSPLPPVTGLENIGRCPWRAFAERRLGVAAMPDPRLGLPDTRGLLLGSVVHRVLETIVQDAVECGAAFLAELVEADGRDVQWPSDTQLDQVVADAARRVAARNGLAATGVAPLLAAQARPYLEVARAMDWPDGTARGVVAAEVKGSVEVGEAGTVRFRADRLDRDDDGLVLVDYKSGKPQSTAKGEAKRREHLLAEVARGRTLQAVAYALGLPGSHRGVGRYLSLRPEIGEALEEMRRTSVLSGDVEMAAAFDHAITTIVSGWRAGAVPPRVVEARKPNETPAACGFCPVEQACLRSDSGYLGNIVQWMSGEAGKDTRIETAARALWWLGVERSEADGG